MSANAESKDPIDFILWVTLITSAFSFSVCLVCGCLGFAVAKQRRKIKCPMCRLWTTVKRWQNGEHREFCAKRNEYFLKQLPEPFDVRCPACLRYMKLMPKVSFKKFVKIQQSQANLCLTKSNSRLFQLSDFIGIICFQLFEFSRHK